LLGWWLTRSSEPKPLVYRLEPEPSRAESAAHRAAEAMKLAAERTEKYAEHRRGRSDRPVLIMDRSRARRWERQEHDGRPADRARGLAAAAKRVWAGV